jgi:hypothetical protein
MIQRTVFRRIFVLSVFLGLATTQDAVAEFVVNGSFESPTFSGSGDFYSTDPGVSLPGWTVPTGGNQFFLEFGAPFGIPRHNDGSQVVARNGDGIQVSLSQTLNWVAGRTYLLTFALADEQVNRAGSRFWSR